MKKLLLIILLFSLSGCSNTVDLTAASDISATALASKYSQASEVKSKYRLINTALKMTAKSDPKDTIKVTVGSDEVLLGGAGEFEPSVKISRWDEVSLKMTPKGLDKIASKDKKLSFEGNKIKFETPKVDYKMYDLPISKENEEGAYEIEAILKEKPASNVVEFDIETQGVDFFYQPALANENPDGSTWEETDGDRSERPVNINGSYAVYYENGKSGDFSATVGKKNYKAGKMGHIYRPKIIDAKGNWTWGEFNQDLQTTKNLTVTIPQDFLDKAVYPVVVDPTFGYTTAGATAAGTADNVRCTKGTPAENSSVYGVYHYGGNYSGTADTLGVIYDASYNLLTYSSAVSRGSYTSTHWKEYTVTLSVTASTVYWVCGSGSSGTDYLISYYDASASNDCGYQNTAYNTTPVDPWNPTLQARYYSIYAQYSCTSGTCTDTFVASGNWKAPTGVSSVNVECWGGGAGGSGSGSVNKNGGGGGAYSASTGVSVTPGNSYAVVAGDRGTGGSTGAGGNGGDSSFDSTTVVAKGGLANGTGGAAASGAGTTKYSGGNGVATSAGGGGGGAGTGGNGGNASGSTGGTGTATGGGNGGDGSAANASSGSNYGGAGGGSSGGAGGYGASGACTITYTISAPSSPSTNKQMIIIFD